MVETSPKSRHPVRQLVGKRPLSRLQLASDRSESAIQTPPSLGFESDGEGSGATRTDPAQSSMPVVGDDGTAISRAGIRPAK